MKYENRYELDSDGKIAVNYFIFWYDLTIRGSHEEEEWMVLEKKK